MGGRQAYMIAAMKKILFLLGIALAGGGFLAAAMELSARAMNPELGMLPGALDVWRTVSPDTLLRALGPNPGGGWRMLLALPGWLVLGAPGFALILAFHPHGEGPSAEDEDSLFLYDELSRRAREDGFVGGDDTAPSHPDDFVPADQSFAEDGALDDVLPHHEPPPGTDEAAPEGGDDDSRKDDA